jgi:hypothetical protein
MKNIHVLPTDKPSNIVISTIDGKLKLNNNTNDNVEYHGQNQNIYITNSEEIKEGDYIINIESLGIFQHHYKDGSLRKQLRKIILTTDQDLIKNGVQAIDDEFLEWFVKNPSCEEVEIVSAKTIPALQLTGNGHCWWKIIIPKEETKQETLEEAKKYLSNEGYGKGSNFTLNNVANLMIEWQQEQDKNMYSEEEMLKMLHKFGFDYTYNYKGEKTIYEWIPEWFEEYKRLNN